MLGDKIADAAGSVKTQRVLPGDDHRFLKIEVSVEQAGTVFGVGSMDMATYTMYERVPGQLYGEGQGIIQTEDGQGAIWNGHGIGHMVGDGLAMSFRFAIAFQAPAEGPLARLNGVLGVGEHEVDADGNTTTSIWEWK